MAATLKSAQLCQALDQVRACRATRSAAEVLGGVGGSQQHRKAEGTDYLDDSGSSQCAPVFVCSVERWSLVPEVPGSTPGSPG